MKKWMRFAAAALSALALCAVFGAVLLIYAIPIEDRVYDLSLNWEGEEIPDGWVYDQKGWTVFTQEEDSVTVLDPDGWGGFTGMAEPGQTLYYSRTLVEDVDCPTLRLKAEEASVAVFLDDVLLYTDCPELDNRVGRLRLPMLELYRDEPVTVTLPRDYQGKTLTVAQGTYPEWETDKSTVWLCAAALYSGYAYESALIAESFQTAVPASLAFAAGVVLLFLLVLQTSRGAPDISTVCGALLAFFWLSGRLAQTSFARYYFSSLPVDVVMLCWNLSLTLLLAFLSSHLTGRRSVLPWALTAIHGVTVLIGLIFPSGTASMMQKASLIGLAGLLTVLICGFGEWRRGSWFYRWFCLLMGAGIALWCAAALSTPTAAAIWQQFTMGAFGYILWWLMLPAAAAALITAIAGAVREEFARRTHARLLAQRAELAQNSYEAMRRQHEQVMILRHDMMKHVRLLRHMTGDPKVVEYLDEIIGQEEEIRPVVRSGNEMLDIILNSKLADAAGAGIAAEIVQMQAPSELPLSDTELCSLVVNLLDNALAAASAPEVERRYIKLDLHVKNGFFTFQCENASTPDWMGRETEPEHGLGREIVRQIVKRHGDLLKVERGSDFYRVTFVIPPRQTAQ